MSDTVVPDTTTDGSLKSKRTAPGVEAFASSFLDNLFFVQGRYRERATLNDLYMALAHTVRDRLVERWIQTVRNYRAQDARVVCYLSAEFLTGPHLANNLINLGIYEEAEEAMRSLDLSLDTLIEQEEEPGLGNGGLGRLASCFMDSLATLDIPAIGYGIYYEYGIFDQVIRDGWQVETTDKWLRLGNPWAIERPEDAFEVKFGGRTETFTDVEGQYRVRWIPEKLVRGIPHDTPILGYRTNTANTMRLWSAAGRRIVRLSRPSTPAISSAPWPTRSRRRTSPRSFIPTTKRFRASSCGSSSSSSLSPARCSTSCRSRPTRTVLWPICTAPSLCR